MGSSKRLRGGTLPDLRRRIRHSLKLDGLIVVHPGKRRVTVGLGVASLNFSKPDMSFGQPVLVGITARVVTLFHGMKRVRRTVFRRSFARKNKVRGPACDLRPACGIG